MKRNSKIKYLSVILASICWATVAVTPAYPTDPVHIAQLGSDYNSYMQQGYTATAKRDYGTALINFRRALKVRPGDRYAQKAIDNVSSYVAKKRGSRISVVPSGVGAPSRRQGGSARQQGSCLSGKKLIALVPENELGLTTAEYPVIFFYLPPTSAKTLKFTLEDQSNGKTHETKVTTPRAAGIVSFSLSTFKDLPPLEIGKTYRWDLSIICDSQNKSASALVYGSVQRIELDPFLASELKRAAPRDRVSLYAVNGIWYDTLRSLDQARQSSPNDSSLADEWADLLKSVGLDAIAREPLVQCCTVRN